MENIENWRDPDMKLVMQLSQQERRGYDIIVKRGCLSKAGQLANFNRQIMVVSDEGVPEKYVKEILAQCGSGEVFIIKQGEKGKSPEMWQALTNRMLDLHFGRNSAIVAVGGGVVGDLSGFTAATYMRGISYFQVPTTSLSQIDSSIGGKTAINMGGSKNMVGAFHQPELVIIDPDTLATLPARQYSNGLAEALKTALIGSSELFDLMENEDIDENIEKILYLCLRYKMGVVQRDETEQGERKILNFGHTIGHGIEAAGIAAAEKGEIKAEEALLHGECVALGMLPMIENRSLARRTKAIMKKLKLPLKHSFGSEEIYKYMINDKKRNDDEYTVVRVKKPGQGYLENISAEELRLICAEA